MRAKYIFKFSLLITLSLFQIQLNAQEISLSEITKSERLEGVENLPYILGEGDSLLIEVLDVPEVSGEYTIGPDGTLYLPRLRSVVAKGLSIDELRIILEQKFQQYIIDPIVYVKPFSYRPVKVYVSGEVARPGYYFISNSSFSINKYTLRYQDEMNALPELEEQTDSSVFSRYQTRLRESQEPSNVNFPKVFDALKIAGGITPYSDLRKVTVKRKLSKSLGGGKAYTTLDFFEVIDGSNDSQNINIFDGDVIHVGKSTSELKDQIIKATNSNLNPDSIRVYVMGRVRNPGPKILPQGTTLEQALSASGGQKILRGQVEFVRLSTNGDSDKRRFFFRGNIKPGSYKNPILVSGDIVRVNDSPISATFDVMNEITTPAIGLYSIYNLLSN